MKTHINALDAVRDLIAKGYAPIPVPLKSKGPTTSGWQKLRLTQADIATHFTDPLGNVGVLNGVNDVVDIDLDAMEAVQLASAFLPETGLIFGRASKPRSHWIYRCANASKTIQLKDSDGTNGRNGSMIVELRSWRTQTLWPPSTHPSGEAITYAVDDKPAQVSAERLTTAVHSVAATALLARHWPRVEGSRHDIALAAAGYLLRGGMDVQLVAKIIRLAAWAAGDEEYAKREKDVYDTDHAITEGKLVTGGPTLVDLIGEPVVQSLTDWLLGGHSAHSAYSAAGGTTWEPPVDLAKVDVPPFPVDALPPVVGDWVSEIASSVQVPLDIPGTIALGVVAGAAAGKVQVQVGNTHREPLNLYCAPAAESGERKTQPLRYLLAPLGELERELVQEHRSRPDSDFAGPRPPDPKLTVGNCTTEKLEVILEQQGGVVCMASEEAGSVFEIAAGRYSKDGSAQLDTLLQAYDGARLDTQRITRDGVTVPRATLTIIVTPQPVILKDFSRRPEFRHRGLLGRFLFALPSSLVGTRMYRNNGRRVDIEKVYWDRIKAIASLPKPAYPFEIPVVQIEGDALAVWAEFHDRIERAQIRGGRLEHIRDWASKHASRVARIAAGIHVVEHPNEPWKVRLAPDTMKRACRIGDYLVEHALAAFQLMETGGAVDDAHHLLAWIQTTKKETFTKREAFNANRGRFPKVDDLERALRLLENHNWVRERETPRQPGLQPQGRRPSPTYEVHPLSQNAHNTQNPEPTSDAHAESTHNGHAPDPHEPTSVACQHPTWVGCAACDPDDWGAEV